MSQLFNLNIRQLIATMSKESSLICHLYSYRDSLNIKIADILALVDNNLDRVDKMKNMGIITEIQGYISLDEAFVTFFDNVCNIRENVSSAEIIAELENLVKNIRYHQMATTPAEKEKYVNAAIKILRRIVNYVISAATALRFQVEITYKQEKNYEIKKEKIEDYKLTNQQIKDAMGKLDEIIAINKHFFECSSNPYLSATVHYKHEGIAEAQTKIMATFGLIKDYLNKYEEQGEFIKHVAILKSYKDNNTWREKTNINTLVMPTPPQLSKPKHTRPHLSLATLTEKEDLFREAVVKLSKKRKIGHIKRQTSPSIPSGLVSEQTIENVVDDYRSILSAFLRQREDLFKFLQSFI